MRKRPSQGTLLFSQWTLIHIHIPMCVRCVCVANDDGRQKQQFIKIKTSTKTLWYDSSPKKSQLRLRRRRRSVVAAIEATNSNRIIPNQLYIDTQANDRERDDDETESKDYMSIFTIHNCESLTLTICY